MTKTISALAEQFIEGFRKKVDLNKLDTIEVYDAQKTDLSDSSLTGIYGWADSNPTDISGADNIFGYSIEWKKDKDSIVDVMEEIKGQLQNEYTGEIKPIQDGIRMVLKRIKK